MQHIDRPILTAAEMSKAERDSGVDLAVLMERAGALVAEAAWRFGAGRPILILCGPGNNGGDGYVAARFLRGRGLDVRIAALADPSTDLAKAARAGWGNPVEALDGVVPAPVIIDALFGTGLSRGLSTDLQAQIKRLMAAARFSLAVDVPSGVGTDCGSDFGVHAVDFTLALGALKPAHVLHPAKNFCGIVKVGDVGISTSSKLCLLKRPKLTEPDADSHKYARGYVVVIGGAMGGAAMLAAKAAMPLAGYVALVGARRIGPDALVSKRWADVADDPRVGAMLVGPGLGRDAAAEGKLADAMTGKCPLVLDADALMLTNAGVLAKLARSLVLTPHEGEFAALFPHVKGNKIERARAAALEANAIVVLKGADTIIAAPDGRAVASTHAPGWLASAGTGDVLAGIITARLSNCKDPFQAACEGVWLHAAAGRSAGPAFTADVLVRHIPEAVAQCL